MTTLTPGGVATGTNSNIEHTNRAGLGQNSLPPSFAGGRYEVKGFLGEGGRKRVYFARDMRLDRDVALALIKTDGLDADGLTRVHREAQAMGRLGDHPHVVTIYDIGEEAGQPYIVSQYMAGGSVDGLLAQADGHRLNVADAMRIADDICQALEHAHTRGVIHRDLKPGNVWLTPDGTAQLGDFGLAIALDRSRLSLAGSMVGTVAYMPPEQATGREADARSDLYSLGAMLYEMVTGRPPFVGDDAVAVISQHLNTPPVSPSWHNPSLPPSLETLILQLLAKAPEERPRSAAAVRERLAIVARAPEEIPVQPASAATPASGLTSLVWGHFIGRTQELATMKRAVENALGGQGALVLLAGEPGVGKTRLAEEAGVYARLRGAQVLIGRCDEDEGTPAFWPWIQVIRSYVHEREPAALVSELGPGGGDIAQLVSEIRERLPGLPTPPAMEPDQARFRLFDSITSFLKNASRSQPIVICLDDLHWADQASLRLLRFLARDLTGTRLLIVGTYRDGGLDRRKLLAETLAELGRERPYERINLAGLTAIEVTALLEAMAQHELDANAKALALVLHQETEGNPFFIEEIMRHLAESGRIYRKDGRWTGDPRTVSELGVSEGVRQVIGGRLAQLSDDCNLVLRAGATIGREFGIKVLQAVVDLDGDQLLDALDEAVAAGVLNESALVDDTYAFGHNLVRETLYGELRTAVRVRMHRRIAEALETLYGSESETQVAQLAHHYFEANRTGDTTKAFDYSVKAGARATALLAYDEAVAHYERGLSLIPSSAHGQAVEIDLLLALGDAQWRAGGTPLAQEIFIRAAGAARAAGDSTRFANAALGYGIGLGGYGLAESPDPTLVSLLEEALVGLPTDDSAMRVRVMARLAVALYYTDQAERRHDLSRDALDMANRLDDPEVRLVAMHSAQSATLGPDVPLRDRLDAANELVRLAESSSNSEMVLRGLMFEVMALQQLGDLEAVDRNVARVRRLADELRMPLYHWVGIQQDACRALMDGRFEEAEKLINSALAMGEQVGEEAALAGYGGQAIILAWGRGRLAEIEPGAQVFVDRYPWIPAYRCAHAWMLTELGRHDEARAVFAPLAEDGFASFRRDGTWLVGMLVGSLVCTHLEDEVAAAAMYELLVPFADWNASISVLVNLGSASLAVAILAGTLKRYDEAERYFDQAIRRSQASGSKPFAALAIRELVAMLRRQDKPDDRPRVLLLASELLDLARELGMTALIEQALAFKLEAQGVMSIDVSASLYAIASAVEAEQPDLRQHVAPDGTVTLLFSDIEGSTAMAERLGDDRWLAVLRRHNALIRDHVARNDGYEVKSVGDGFMLAFGSARKALRCAVEIQRSLAASPVDDAVHVRIGLHTGEAIQEANDFFGKNVIVASRIAAGAKGTEIVVSSLLKELVESSGEFRFGEAESIDLRGIAQQCTVHRVDWVDSDPN